MPIYGFNSFEGLPEHWRTGFGKGSFSTPIPTVPGNVKLIKGLFADTLPHFLKGHTEPISFLHIDCDLYSSSKFIFETLGDRIGTGCVIVFDEYFNYPGWKEHEFKAFSEFVSTNRIEYRYEAFVASHQQVCVVIE